MDTDKYKTSAAKGYLVMRNPDDAVADSWVAIDLEGGYVGLDVDAEGALKQLLTVLDGR